MVNPFLTSFPPPQLVQCPPVVAPPPTIPMTNNAESSLDPFKKTELLPSDPFRKDPSSSFDIQMDPSSSSGLIRMNPSSSLDPFRTDVESLTDPFRKNVSSPSDFLLPLSIPSTFNTSKS